MKKHSAQSSELNAQLQNGNDCAISESDIDEVYRRMSRMYGHRWTSNYGDADDGTWFMVLTGLRRSDLSRGLRALLSRTDEWPPSAPVFRQMCLGIDRAAIRHRAEELARENIGGSYNFRMLAATEASRLVRSHLDEAAEELVIERTKLAATGKLRKALGEAGESIERLVHTTAS